MGVEHAQSDKPVVPNDLAERNYIEVRVKADPLYIASSLSQAHKYLD